MLFLVITGGRLSTRSRVLGVEDAGLGDGVDGAAGAVVGVVDADGEDSVMRLSASDGVSQRMWSASAVPWTGSVPSCGLGVLHAGEVMADPPLTGWDGRRSCTCRMPKDRRPRNGSPGRSWLARVYFGSRLLAEGWRMLHAAAVTVDAGAVLVLAGPWGGKSTLVHRACREHGAAFLADDLVFLGEDGTLVGWPTRVALPVSLCTGVEIPRRQRRVVDGQLRDRALFAPPEYRRALPSGTRSMTWWGSSWSAGNPWRTDRLIVEAPRPQIGSVSARRRSRVAAQSCTCLICSA